jgi:hypothetical protein
MCSRSGCCTGSAIDAAISGCTARMCSVCSSMAFASSIVIFCWSPLRMPPMPNA